MEKVKVTREIADAIKFGIKHHSKDDIVRAHTNVKGWRLVCELKPLRHMPLGRLIKALYIGYEVEETFKVGDWVVLDDGQIVEIMVDGSLTFIVGWIANGSMYKEYVSANKIERHATKQEKWWAKHGRKVWELKENDLLYYDDEFKEVEEVAELGSIMLSLERAYFPLETIKRKYSIACFAEDRKDVK